MRCFTDRFLLGYGRKTNFERANASSPTSTNGIAVPFSSLGRSFSSGIFNSFFSSKRENADCLKMLESLDEP
jgi:hypothetical protein